MLIWREGYGGCRSQGCHGYPSRSARRESWPTFLISGTIPQAYLLLMSLIYGKQEKFHLFDVIGILLVNSDELNLNLSKFACPFFLIGLFCLSF